jgi:erythronate-4-phosphate dehydrogenase
MDGKYRSYHLADSHFFDNLNRCRLLVNASRGAVVDNDALLAALDAGKVGCAAIDVWENEPEISLPLLERAYIATPHIAGYSAEGKMNATLIVLREFMRHTGYTGEVPAL